MLNRDEHFTRLNEWNKSQEWKDGHYNFNALIGQKWEIPESVYWEFLEVLPPVGYRNGAFYMSEMLSGDITSRYSQIGDKYFHEYANLPVKLHAQMYA